MAAKKDKHTSEAGPEETQKIMDAIEMLHTKVVMPLVKKGMDPASIDGAILEYLVRIQAIHVIDADNSSDCANAFLDAVKTRLTAAIKEEAETRGMEYAIQDGSVVEASAGLSSAFKTKGDA